MKIAPALLTLIFANVALADKFDPNKIYIDKNVCPGEWCSFGEWTASKDIDIYDAPNSSNPPIGTIKKDQTVKAITGDAYVKPQKYIITEKATREVIWVLTYVSEGFFKVWENGTIVEKDLGAAPGDPDIVIPYKMAWWVKFELPGGVVGWAKVEGGFKDDSP